jgi:threonine aldolase
MSTTNDGRRQFASDNYAGICPEAWQAMVRANTGHVLSYGEDPWTARAADLLRDLFETDCEVFFVFNGTAASAARRPTWRPTSAAPPSSSPTGRRS